VGETIVAFFVTDCTRYWWLFQSVESHAV